MLCIHMSSQNKLYVILRLFTCTFIHVTLRTVVHVIHPHQGWQWGGAGLKDGVFVPAPHGFFLPHPRPAPHDGEYFLTPSPPLGAPRSLALPRKTLLFVNLPYNQYNFLMKPISLIKIYLKLQLNLSHQIKSIFRKH